APMHSGSNLDASLSQRLEGLRDPDVLGVAALIQIQLLLLDRLHLSPDGGGIAGSERGGRGFPLICGVVRPFPGEPVGGPLAMSALDLLRAEGESSTGRAIERRRLRGKELARGRCERLPDEERARIALHVDKRRGEEREQRRNPLARRLLTRGAQLRDDLPPGP